MSQSQTHKQFFINDLEWLVMTPLILQQYRVYYAESPAGGGQASSAGGGQASRPLGVLFWGFVDAEVEARLAAGNAKLRPQDWKSGDKLWVMPEACLQHDDVIAPFGGVDVSAP